MASVLITVLLYCGPLLCGFNVPIKGFSALKSKNCEPLIDTVNTKLTTTVGRLQLFLLSNSTGKTVT